MFVFRKFKVLDFNEFEASVIINLKILRSAILRTDFLKVLKFCSSC